MSGVIVLGAGIAGIAAAREFRARDVPCDIFEEGDSVGGHAGSFAVDGFVFDRGPHVSFTANQEVRTAFSNAVGGRFLEWDPQILNLWRGVWLQHPAQCHLNGLPIDLVERCVVDFATRPATDTIPRNFAEWCLASFGRTFSEEFSFRYTRKHWAAEPERLTVDWIGSKIYAPTLRDVVRGALAPRSPSTHHYISSFRYPSAGGFGAYAAGLAAGLDVRTGSAAVDLDLRRHIVTFSDGSARPWECLVSSIPLPELVRITREVPPEVSEAASSLACTSVELVSVGVGRREGFPEAQWAYFYDDDISFSRASFPHRLSPGNAPEGAGSVLAEVYHSRYRALEGKDILTRVMDDMYRAGLLDRSDQVLVADHRSVRYANVLFDSTRAAAVAEVREYFACHDVETVGRYGRWDYSWTDEAFLSGRRAAGRVAAHLKPLGARSTMQDRPR